MSGWWLRIRYLLLGCFVSGVTAAALSWHLGHEAGLRDATAAISAGYGRSLCYRGHVVWNPRLDGHCYTADAPHE